MEVAVVDTMVAVPMVPLVEVILEEAMAAHMVGMVLFMVLPMVQLHQPIDMLLILKDPTKEVPQDILKEHAPVLLIMKGLVLPITTIEDQDPLLLLSDKLKLNTFIHSFV